MNKIDNFRFGFSGIAGFNKWFYCEDNEYVVWENIIRAEQHMNGQDVKNVIGGEYIQGRQAITLDFTNELEHDEGQVLEMQYYLSEDKNSAVGYVYNRTVNYRTAGITSDCRSQPFGDDYLNFDQITNIDWTDDGPYKKLKISDLPSGEDYDIDFYGHEGMDYIFTSHVSTGSNDKLIIEFPELTKEYPVVWFVCKKVGGRTDSSTSDIQEHSKLNESIVYPNPTTGKLYIPKNLGTFEIYNSLGMKILVNELQINRDEIQLDFDGFAKGIYSIHFGENAQTVKICVL